MRDVLVAGVQEDGGGMSGQRWDDRSEHLLDDEILRRRSNACARLPWVLPATVLLEITDADLDALASAPDGEYWTVLNRIVYRITPDGTKTRHEGW